jgi:hypothetical protein
MNKFSKIYSKKDFSYMIFLIIFLIIFWKILATIDFDMNPFATWLHDTILVKIGIAIEKMKSMFGKNITKIAIGLILIIPFLFLSNYRANNKNQPYNPREAMRITIFMSALIILTILFAIINSIFKIF